MNNILILSEGHKSEPKLFENYLKVLKSTYPEISSLDVKIYSYNSNIYVLYNKIKKYKMKTYFSTSTMEILKEMSQEKPDDLELKEILKNQYSEIYLIFDLEYHDTLYESCDKKTVLKEMLDTFNNETENGLLFINYPMIEAYRHWKDKSTICQEFEASIITCAQSHDYKAYVTKNGNSFDVNKFTMDDYNNIAKSNVMKASLIVNSRYEIPDYEKFIKWINGVDFLNAEFFHISKDEIYVLCTCMFLFINYFGEKYFDKLK